MQGCLLADWLLRLFFLVYNQIMTGIIKKIKNRAEKFSSPVGRGFTLVEMLVATTIFSMSMGVVMELFLHSMHIQRTLVAHAQLISEMSYNLEHISRGLRMAKKSADSACLSAPGKNFEITASGVKFLNPKLNGGVECVEYYLSGQTLFERRNAGVWSFDLPLTSPDVKVLSFSAAGSGWSQEDFIQPRVTVYIKAQSKESEILENQITVSQRDIDINE